MEKGIDMDEGDHISVEKEEMSNLFKNLKNWFLLKVDGKWINVLDTVVLANSRNEIAVQKLKDTVRFKEMKVIESKEVLEPVVVSEKGSELFGFIDMSGPEKKDIIPGNGLTVLQTKCPQKCSEEKRKWICTSCGDFVKGKFHGELLVFCSCGGKPFDQGLLVCHKCEEKKHTVPLDPCQPEPPVRRKVEVASKKDTLEPPMRKKVEATPNTTPEPPIRRNVEAISKKNTSRFPPDFKPPEISELRKIFESLSGRNHSEFLTSGSRSRKNGNIPLSEVPKPPPRVSPSNFLKPPPRPPKSGTSIPPKPSAPPPHGVTLTPSRSSTPPPVPLRIQSNNELENEIHLFIQSQLEEYSQIPSVDEETLKAFPDMSKKEQNDFLQKFIEELQNLNFSEDTS